MFRLLASYPKSGNTYVRIFLANYIRGETDLNKIGWPLFNSRVFFPLGNPTNRRAIYFRDTKNIRYAKTHEVATHYYPQAVERAVYIVRNPIDVTPSWSRHMSISLEASITAMGRNNRLRGRNNIFPQQIGSWSTNVRSWLNQKSFPVFIIRYETLSSNPEQGFGELLRFLGIPINTEKFKQTLGFVEFQNLKKLEEEKGFKEARGSTGKFFNVGRSGNGQEVLTAEQIRRIMDIHGPTMRLLGYA